MQFIQVAEVLSFDRVGSGDNRRVLKTAPRVVSVDGIYDIYPCAKIEHDEIHNRDFEVVIFRHRDITEVDHIKIDAEFNTFLSALAQASGKPVLEVPESALETETHYDEDDVEVPSDEEVAIQKDLEEIAYKG